MEVIASKVEIFNELSSTSEASVRVSNTVMSVEETEAAIKGLSRVVELAFNHHKEPIRLSYVAKTDIQI